MSANRKKCPLCSRKLVEINGIPTCPDCGFREPGSAAGTGMGTGSFREAEKEKKEKKERKALRPALFLIPAAAVVVVCLLVFALSEFRGTSADPAGSIAESREASSDVPEAEQALLDGIRANRESGRAGSSDGEGGTVSGEKQSFVLPESEFLTELVEALFGKPVSQVTYEELYSIMYLDIYYLNDTDVLAADVYLSDGSGGSWLMADGDVDTGDLSCLEGLQYLYLEAGYVSYDTDWHNLKNLQALSCNASIPDITGYIDVSQLVYLGVGETFGMSDLSLLSEFSNLQYLELDAGLLDSIAGVSQAPALTALSITGGDRITDFSELYDMPQLEELSIESEGLKDIGFIEGMDNLQYLALKGTEVRNLSPILECADTLRVLCLDDNYQAEDISPVFACTGLEKLQLWVEYQFDVPMEAPDFSAMTNLYSLSLEGYDKFDSLALLPGLEELTIEGLGSGDGAFLKELTNLKTLNLVNMSVYDGFFDNLSGLESLVTLNLEDSFVWCDISPVFELPNLQELNLEWAECGLQPEKLMVSESLSRLNLTHAVFDGLLEDGSWNFGNETELAMQEVLEAMAPCMPALTQLYVPRQNLDNLDFVSELPALTLLDVEDNYITDLSPLTGLEQLVVLICGDNPIESTDGLEDVIIQQ